MADDKFQVVGFQVILGVSAANNTFVPPPFPRKKDPKTAAMKAFDDASQLEADDGKPIYAEPPLGGARWGLWDLGLGFVPLNPGK